MRCKYGCDYDVCNNCWKNMAHPHPLQINHSNRNVKCIGCNVLIYGRYHHCKVGCEYDFCDNCLKTQSQQRGANANPLARSLPVGGAPNQQNPLFASVQPVQPVQPVPQVRHIHVPVAQPVQPDLHIHVPVPVQRDPPEIGRASCRERV